MPARRPFLTGLLVAGACLTGAGLGGCGNDGPSTDRLAEDLIAETDGALDESQARCVADGLEEAFGEDSYRRVLDAAETDDVAPDAGTDNSAADESADVRVQVVGIFAECDALGAAVVDGP